jgi:antitoxin component of MazEF toxin-antitoxin module
MVLQEGDSMAEVLFKKTARTMGNSIYVTIPTELLEYLDIKEGDELALHGEEKSKGRFIALWKSSEAKKQQ